MTALIMVLVVWPAVSILAGLALGRFIHTCETHEPRRTP